MENLMEERVNSTQLEALNQTAPPDVKRSGWQKLMTTYIGIIPLPVYIVLLGVVIGFVLTGKIPTEINMVIAVMAICGFTLGEIGKRLPILRDIGAATIIALLVPSYLKFNHMLPASLLQVVSNFYTSTSVLYLFIAIVVVGSILSMDRHVLVTGFFKVFIPVLTGSVLATIVGLLVGQAFGLGAYRTFFFIIVPIMGGGIAEGAIPLTFGYSQILHQAQPNLLAQVLPAIFVGNFAAILLGGLLNYMGKKTPRLTGEGNLEPGKHDDVTPSQEKSRQSLDITHIAAVGITGITLYLLGILCSSLSGIAWASVIVMIGLAIAIKLSGMVSPELQNGASHLYKFASAIFTLPILFALSISSIKWDQLVAGFALPNLVTGLSVVLTLMVTGFFVGRWIRLFPIEASLINLCHSGMGGTGDVAILSAANRMKLMPFAQIATRIGGIIMVSIALLLLAHFV